MAAGPSIDGGRILEYQHRAARKYPVVPGTGHGYREVDEQILADLVSVDVDGDSFPLAVENG
jgi:hypothetical protein